jgi:hypothetical protein
VIIPGRIEMLTSRISKWFRRSSVYLRYASLAQPSVGSPPAPLGRPCIPLVAR